MDAFEGYAYDAGLRIGDQILSVDGQDTSGLSITQVGGAGWGYGGMSCVHP